MEDINGQEVSLFMHCHLRAYDKNGEGNTEDRSYLDQYGAPVETRNSWVEGYHEIEKQLADNQKKLQENEMKFPPIVGLGGAAHLYKEFHENEPWNWTGWIPLQNQFYHKQKYIYYRDYIGIRGNEIQNNLWDYPPPKEEDEDNQMTDPKDKYRGGYWFEGNAFGRYLHIIALKSHDVDSTTGKCLRYNYIVHPLAYREFINELPDNSVDAMQWCVYNMPEEVHFGEDQPWGERCHGLEIFNDFTYFYSYQPIEEGGPNNGQLATTKLEDQENKPKHYYYWFDTYPLEFAEFVLNSGLARGSYFHTVTANDAYYDRNVFDKYSDPKSSLYDYIMKQSYKASKASALGVRKADLAIERENKLSHFVRSLAYKKRTVLGFVTVLDTNYLIKNTVFEDGNATGLDEAGNIVLDYLIKGRYYSSTGIHDLFHCDSDHPLPYTIKDQPDPNEMCYNIDQSELLFTFQPITEDNTDLVWRYTIMLKKFPFGLETIHGYFKLSKEGQTNLDLRCYEKCRVKWLYFTAIRPTNPQQRAWFHAIRGPAFGHPQPDAKQPPLEHHVEATRREKDLVTPAKRITPTSVETDHLDFLLGTTTNEHDIYVYSMQVCPHQQPRNKNTRESSKVIPRRILQSVHGYFNLRNDYPTRLNLCSSWDSKTVKGPVLFYIVDGETGDPRPIPDSEKPILFGN